MRLAEDCPPPSFTMEYKGREKRQRQDRHVKKKRPHPHRYRLFTESGSLSPGREAFSDGSRVAHCRNTNAYTLTSTRYMFIFLSVNGKAPRCKDKQRWDHVLPEA